MTGRRGGDPTRRRGHKTPWQITHSVALAIGRTANMAPTLQHIGKALNPHTSTPTNATPAAPKKPIHLQRQASNPTTESTT